MQISEIMTKNPACCTPDTTLREIAQMMVEHDCGCIPVVDNQQSKKPVGTVTDRDITIRAFTTGGNPLEMKASDVMTMGVATVTPETSIQQCADVMEDKKIRRVLVVYQNGRCCGIVAQADIAEYGPNPTLISEVVHEISESEPSPNREVFRRVRNNQSYSPNRSFQSNRSFKPNRSFEKNQSFRVNRPISGKSEKSEKVSLINTNSLLPLLAGIGIAVGAKYFFDNGSENRRVSVASRRPTNLPRISQGSTVDTRANLSHQTEIHSFKKDTTKKDTTENSAKTDSAFSNRESETNTDTEISRTAGQG